MTRINWRLMKESDLADICRIASVCHPDFPEGSEVLAEKLALSPDTCFVLDHRSGIGGYLFAHPYKLGSAPALDKLLGSLPAHADTLYLHDIALLPEARSGGAAATILCTLAECARKSGLETLSLIAVNRSPPFWEKQGFSALAPLPALLEKLRTYSNDALYMVRCLK